MMNDKAPITVGAFARDLRWMLPLSVGTMLVLFLLDVGGMRDLGLMETLLVGVGFVVVLGPLTWLWWERMGRSDPAAWKFLGWSDGVGFRFRWRASSRLSMPSGSSRR